MREREFKELKIGRYEDRALRGDIKGLPLRARVLWESKIDGIRNE